MKTRNFNKEELYNVAYGYDGDISPEMWISSHSDVIFKRGSTGSSFVVRLSCGTRFDVLVRPFRKRFWSVLFTNDSARYLLQDFYDFLYC